MFLQKIDLPAMVDNDIGMVLLYSDFLIMSGGEEYRYKERKV